MSGVGRLLYEQFAVGIEHIEIKPRQKSGPERIFFSTVVLRSVNSRSKRFFLANQGVKSSRDMVRISTSSVLRLENFAETVIDVRHKSQQSASVMEMEATTT